MALGCKQHRVQVFDVWLKEVLPQAETVGFFF